MTELPESLRRLIERFEPDAFDAPTGRARVRLVVTDAGQWDVIIEPEGVAVADAGGTPAPDATLTADSVTWCDIARDVRAGMVAYQAARLVVRHNLHLGIGFLVATSGATGPGRPRFRRIETA